MWVHKVLRPIASTQVTDRRRHSIGAVGRNEGTGWIVLLTPNKRARPNDRILEDIITQMTELSGRPLLTHGLAQASAALARQLRFRKDSTQPTPGLEAADAGINKSHTQIRASMGSERPSFAVARKPVTLISGDTPH